MTPSAGLRPGGGKRPGPTTALAAGTPLGWSHARGRRIARVSTVTGRIASSAARVSHAGSSRSDAFQSGRRAPRGMNRMGDTDYRLFHHPDGATYRVRLGPPASPHRDRIRSIVLTFERPDGAWVGSVSIRPHTNLAQIPEEDLVEKFQLALGGRTQPPRSASGSTQHGRCDESRRTEGLHGEAP